MTNIVGQAGRGWGLVGCRVGEGLGVREGGIPLPWVSVMLELLQLEGRA